MSRLIDLLSGDIAADEVNELFDLASNSNLRDLSSEYLSRLEQIIIIMLNLSLDSASGAKIYNTKKAEELLVHVRELQCDLRTSP
jgi:hypothetical protein